MTALPHSSSRPSSRPSRGSADAALRSLLPYLAGLTAACLVLQLLIAATGGRITLLAGGCTAVVALGAVAYLAVHGRGLGRLRFGLLLAHALLYVCVNGSFALHAFLRGVLGAGLDPSWAGAALAMPGIWAIGFLVHAAGALAGRGFEAGRP